jgi:hypothetical protein
MNKVSERSSTPGGSRVKVLYIAGWGRSGSTILGRVLGQIKGFQLVGELRYIWDRGLIGNTLCSCGAAFSECPMWQEIVSEVSQANGSINVEEMLALRERGLRTRHVLLAPTHRILQARLARMDKYLQGSEMLYKAVQSVSGSSVIVDTSKFPSYGYVLQNTPGIELYVLHLVRDPRAVAYSWEARKKLMTPHSFIKSSLSWDEWNLAIERLRRYEPERYMALRYEDFVENPRSSVQSILHFLGEEATELPFEDERKISLGASHTFSGNPDRFQSGTVAIKPDEGWKSNMSVARQRMVTALTWPGLVRYGYPLRTQRAAARV